MDFETLKISGLSVIKAMIASGSEETQYLDFKRKADPGRTDLQRDDKKALGEAVSGFANADGGVLIVGVGTSIADGLDRAASEHPIDNVREVAERYRAYLNECASPPVPDCEVVEIQSEADSSGFIAIRIPKSELRPHMSVAPTHHRFYRRTADRFEPMARYEIEDLFRLRRSPNLELVLKTDPGGSIGGHKKFYIRFGLTNTSNGSAKFPSISVRHITSGPRLADYGLDGNGNDLFARLLTASADERVFSGGANVALHPGQTLFVSRLEYMLTTDERMRSYWSLNEMPNDGPVKIQFAFGADDHPRKIEIIEFTEEDLLKGRAPS